MLMLKRRDKLRTMHRSQIRARIVNRAIICRRIPRVICSVLLILAGEFAATSAQTMSPEPAKAPGVAHIESGAPKRTVGYLHDAEPNFLLLLPPYPALDSKQDKIDVTTFRQMQVPDSSARWKLAETDDQMIYTRFSGALGVDLDAAKLPIVIHLLNRLERDVLDTAFDARSISTVRGLFNALPSNMCAGRVCRLNLKRTPRGTFPVPLILLGTQRLDGVSLSPWPKWRRIEREFSVSLRDLV